MASGFQNSADSAIAARALPDDADVGFDREQSADSARWCGMESLGVRVDVVAPDARLGGLCQLSFVFGFEAAIDCRARHAILIHKLWDESIFRAPTLVLRRTQRKTKLAAHGAPAASR
jgi:hypothetical protein